METIPIQDGIGPCTMQLAIEQTLLDAVRIIPAIKLIGLRNRAIILLGYAGAFRQSKLVGLTVDDLQDDDNGLIVRLKKS